jgi:hypothetical protein
MRTVTALVLALIGVPLITACTREVQVMDARQGHLAIPQAPGAAPAQPGPILTTGRSWEQDVLFMGVGVAMGGVGVLVGDLATLIDDLATRNKE